MASQWNLWVWLECIGVVSGCCCKEVYRYPHNNYYFSLHSTCIHYSFFGSSVPISLFIFKNPSSTSKDDVKVNNRTYITITVNLHSLEHSHFMEDFLAEYLGISSDVHHSLL